MTNPTIKSFQKQISDATGQEEKLAIASRLRD